MAYSKSYQTVVAGRPREDEAISFLKKNCLAVPATTGRSEYQAVNPEEKQPTNKSDALNDPNVGKADGSLTPRAATVGAYVPNKINNATSST
jgi:hypothetical protein